MTVPLHNTMSNLARQVNEFHNGLVKNACCAAVKGDNKFLKFVIANTPDLLLRTCLKSL